MATMMLILIGAGAIAVDLSALSARGRVLQNTVDAAALAGVDTWVATGDLAATQVSVNNLVRQNGVTVGDDVSLLIEPDGPFVLRVELTDGSPDIFLGKAIGQGGALVRDATAQFDLCDGACDRRVAVPPPFSAIRAAGTGDGFVPIAVDDRLYAVNHHEDTITCVDRTTRMPCWDGQRLFASSASTATTHHAELVGDRIYYVGFDGSNTVLTCWNTSVDARCGNEISLGNHGHATLAVTDAGLIVLTSTRKVFCHQLVSFNTCANYAGGLDTALVGLADWVEDDQGAYRSDRVVDGDRIFHTLQTSGQLWLHCWDSRNAEPCGSFGTHVVNETRLGSIDDREAGRLFLARNSLANPIALCSLGWNNVECFDRADGARLSGVEADLAPLNAAMRERSWSGWAALNTYHEPTNRLFTVNAFESITYCYDFNVGAMCPNARIVNDVDTFGLARTYGYITENANCLIGLGDATVFFSLQPDLSDECDSTGITVDLTPCACGGVAQWPPIGAEGTNTLQLFDVRIVSPSGSPLLPADGSWFDMRTERLTLESLPTDLPFVRVEIRVEALPDVDPWLAAQPPTFVIGLDETRPALVE